MQAPVATAIITVYWMMHGQSDILSMQANLISGSKVDHYGQGHLEIDGIRKL